MSEEILKALMQLFAIIAKQDEGAEATEYEYVKNFLATQLSAETVEEYMKLFDEKVQEAKKEDEGEASGRKRSKLTSVKDSVKVLGICKKINKTLNQKQKIVVLVRVFELVNADRKFTDQRMAIINTVADVFNISKDEFKSTDAFVTQDEITNISNPDILVINDKSIELGETHTIRTESLDGSILILQIKSSELYFLRYTGKQDIFLNGLGVSSKRIYLFANGSTIKLPKGKPIYYSDVVSNFMADKSFTRISFNVKNVGYVFPTGGIGLRNITFSESQAKLIGIMGASGAGKTTLLNLLSGIASPTSGEVLINGINMHTNRKELEGVIGYIPQDDLLIEELTVFENLYYNAKLCFKNKNEQEIVELVHRTLQSLGLFERKNLKVGSPMNKMISGGQRKRLNIALELIREPSILFVDEPTSGLSSRDSENVMDLLRELTLKGKLIFVVIHQPSSDIYKMFDKMIILDTGGYMVYYGNPVEGVMYFKKIDNQINSDAGECPTCGNVNPELIFNIVESQVVDEFGKYTGNRKTSPVKWEEHFQKNIKVEMMEDISDTPPRNLNIPNWFRQFKIYLLRDFFSKISNTQYIILNMFEAPLMAFILTFLVRYIADPNSDFYIFRENENIPPYIFMCIVVALFLGLTVSAEEIFRDRKILKREKFLNLSRSSYLMSKIVILLIISALQAFLFIIVGNIILGVKDVMFVYWFALFSTFVFSNMMGLNISATFNSAVTIYILIPLLIIPQMTLGGAMFSFDKINRTFFTPGKVPIVAEFMTSRWIYEALMVYQFKNNEFEREFYVYEKQISVANIRQSEVMSRLKERAEETVQLIEENTPASLKEAEENLALLRSEFLREEKREFNRKKKEKVYLDEDMIQALTLKTYNDSISEEVLAHIEELKKFYGNIFEEADTKKQNKIKKWKEKYGNSYYNDFRKMYHNEALCDIVQKIYEKNKIVQYKDRLVQQSEPIYLSPEPDHLFDFRTHFYAPYKHFLGRFYDTYWFNMVIVWLISISLYVPLYYEHLKKLIDSFDKVKKIVKRVENKIAKAFRFVKLRFNEKVLARLRKIKKPSFFGKISTLPSKVKTIFRKKPSQNIENESKTNS